MPNNEVLLVKDNGKSSRDILVSNNDEFAERILVTQKGKIDTAILSNDEKKIYFSTNVIDKSPIFGENGIWQVNIDGSNPVKIKNNSGGTQYLIAVFPDQKNLLIKDWKETPNSADVVVLNLETGNTSKVIGQEEGEIHRIELSSDGKQILFGIGPRPTEAEPHPKIKIKLVEFDGAKIGQTKLILSDETHSWQKKFAFDGNSIYYYNNSKRTDIWQFDFATQKSNKITDFNFDTIFNFTVSRDGKKLYIVRGNTTDEVVLIKNVE